MNEDIEVEELAVLDLDRLPNMGDRMTDVELDAFELEKESSSVDDDEHQI